MGHDGYCGKIEGVLQTFSFIFKALCLSTCLVLLASLPSAPVNTVFVGRTGWAYESVSGGWAEGFREEGVLSQLGKDSPCA